MKTLALEVDTVAFCVLTRRLQSSGPAQPDEMTGGRDFGTDPSISGLV